MGKVFVLFELVPYEAERFLGVFANKKLAEEAIDRIIAEEEKENSDYDAQHKDDVVDLDVKRLATKIKDASRKDSEGFERFDIRETSVISGIENFNPNNLRGADNHNYSSISSVFTSGKKKRGKSKEDIKQAGSTSNQSQNDKSFNSKSRGHLKVT